MAAKKNFGLEISGISDRFTNNSNIEDDTDIFSPVSPDANTKINGIDWLDRYVNAHRIAEENIEFMRKWILKVPLNELLTELNTHYVGKMTVFSCEKDRRRNQELINEAIQYEDVTYLIYAYTDATGFFRQLNRDLAKRGSTFRFITQISDRSKDDQPPIDLGEFIFTACLLHHPSVTHFYHSNCTTYRGVNMTQWELEQYVPGARILIRSFLSSSKCKNVPKLYMDLISGEKIPVLCVYHITQIRTAMYIEAISRFPEEQEVLIRPYAVFRVIKVEKAHSDYDEYGRVIELFLEELPSSTDRWDISDEQSTSIEANTSHSTISDQEFISESTLENNIRQLIDELLSNENIQSEKLNCLYLIKDLLSKYCLGDCSLWPTPLLKRLNHTLLTIKTLVNENENIDVFYLNILFARIQQRAGNIDVGLHFPKDGPLILEQLKYEDVLDKRRQDKLLCKSLNELNQQFHEECLSYVKKLIDLHSHVHITGINKDNIDQLAVQLNLHPLTQNERNHLAQKCNPLIIPLQSFVSCRTARSYGGYHHNEWAYIETQRHVLTNNFKQKTLYNDSRDIHRLIAETSFISSFKFNSNSLSQNENISIDSILDILEKYRWIVFLGDPGSAKTTLVRWLALQCAKKFFEYQLEKDKISSARLPILVRIGEIASALDRDSSVSLIDCLCQPTWLGTHLIQKQENKSSFIREYIENGHTLIILDGLDEIPNFRQRKHIVQLIKEFLQKWTICPITLIAPLDELVSDNPVVPILCSTVAIK